VKEDPGSSSPTPGARWAGWSRTRLVEEIARLRAALGPEPSPAPERQGAVAPEHTAALTTVRVPAPFVDEFRRAERFVSSYFEQFRREPERATIAIAGERYLLLRAASLSVEFVDLVMALYRDRGDEEARAVANNLLFDFGHALGCADAQAFHARTGVTDPIARLSTGPVHFAFSGWAFVDILDDSAPSADENFYIRYDHPYSFESHSWLEKGRHSDVPVCVMNAGYSSGWCEESFGISLVAAEVECSAAGDARCRFVMAPPARIESHLQRLGYREATPPTRGEQRVAVPEFFQRRRWEDELREANQRLEENVARRTQELTDANNRLRQQATIDSLTSLPNRSLLYERLEHEIKRSMAASADMALFLIDLDGFKNINDTFGHHIGDTLLEQVGPRLRRAVRSRDLVARLGGDEFAVLLPDVGDRHKATERAGSILEALREPFGVAEQQVALGASIGIAMSPAHGTDASTLLRCADVAMYVSKDRQRGPEVYRADLDRHSPERLSLLSELRSGIEADELVLHYQPQIELTGDSLKRVEALVRWQHPRRGLLSPGEFIPLIELGHLVELLTDWVIRRALADCARWQRTGLDVDVAVNVPPRLLRHSDFTDRLLDLLSEQRLSTSRLTLEVTESSLLADIEHAQPVFEHIRGLGVRMSIDDFGTGFSSFTHLRRLPVDEIKIDRSFVSQMTSHPEDGAIVRSTIDLGTSIGRTIVAEGVEDEQTLQLLRRLGCNLAQGYHFARPMPLPRLLDWARHRPG
jgi:diguanylate cyclase (GGDEF)-like protein